MIKRYSRSEMSSIWTESNRYLTWLLVETAVCEELAKSGGISKKDWLELKSKLNRLQKSGIDPKQVSVKEQKTRHDVLAFTEVVAEQVGPLSRYVHYGLTSSDVVDTAFALQIQQAWKVLDVSIELLLARLKKLALQYQKVPCIGRSHGMYAEPTWFGLKFLSFYAEWKRNHTRLKTAFLECAYGKISGAVGVNVHWSVEQEEKILGRLGLLREPVSTQVVPRDRHASGLLALALAGASIERLATELRHLQRSEVGEVQEGFSKGQKGSSAMPHKRNPISSENLTGCARLLRGYALAELESVALWHERDISHSAVERVAFPDAFILFDYALDRLSHILKNLEINRERIAHNLKQAGSLVYSGHFLLELVNRGMLREDAYEMIQSVALQSSQMGLDFASELAKDKRILDWMNPVEIKKFVSPNFQAKKMKKSVGRIFEKNIKKQTD